MPRHLMIDLETASTEVDAVILSIGAVIFNPFDSSAFKEFYIKPTIESQEKYGLIIDDSTLEWWSKQDASIIEEAFSENDRHPFEDCINQLHKFMWNCDKFWSHGATFDLMIIQNVYKKLKKPIIWKYPNLRDTRTLFDLADPEMPVALKHNALEDAKRQAIGVRNVYRKLGYKG